jgi:PhnB protein
MLVQSYLFFDGRCEEAVEFYRKTLGAEVKMLMRYKDSPQPHPPGMVRPGYENKVMHATFRIGESEVMAADDCQGHPAFQGFSLSVRVDNEGQAKRVFSALAEGGQVKMPLTKTFFSPSFGMLTDRFGVGWMVIVQQSNP